MLISNYQQTGIYIARRLRYNKHVGNDRIDEGIPVGSYPVWSGKAGCRGCRSAL